MNGTIEVRQEEAVRLLTAISPGTVQVIFADPPYGIAYHSNYYKGRNPHAPVARDWNFQIGAFLRAVAVALADGGAAYVCCRWDVLPAWTMEVPPPLELANVIVWVKDNWSAGDLTGNFGFQHEFVMMLTKGRHVLRGKRWPNVWPIARVPHTQLLHPTQKPVALPERAVTSSSSPGELVVDPFCGSGTTGEAATGRRVILGDIDPRMVRVTCGRLGVPLPDLSEEPEAPPPACPVFDRVPPSPSLWGVHPEDLAYALHGDDPMTLERLRAARPIGSPAPTTARTDQPDLFTGGAQ